MQPWQQCIRCIGSLVEDKELRHYWGLVYATNWWLANHTLLQILHHLSNQDCSKLSHLRWKEAISQELCLYMMNTEGRKSISACSPVLHQDQYTLKLSVIWHLSAFSKHYGDLAAGSLCHDLCCPTMPQHTSQMPKNYKSSFLPHS